MNQKKQLKKITGFSGVKGPVVTIVMDGVGIAKHNDGNAVWKAYTPTLDFLSQHYPMVKLKAHGTAAVSYTHLDVYKRQVSESVVAFSSKAIAAVTILNVEPGSYK